MAVVNDFSVTVLGCSGSYNAPGGEACSGYLVRCGATSIWMDCGNGSFANLQRHIDVSDLDAVVVTHSHPDHCVDLYGLHVLATYGLQRGDIPVFAAAEVESKMRGLVSDWHGTFAWHTVGDGARETFNDVEMAFSTTDHPVPTVAVSLRFDGKHAVYTADTGPLWSPEVFGTTPDFLLSEASYTHDDRRSPIHLSGYQAGELARAAQAQRLVLTHLWPTIDADVCRAEAIQSFGAEVTLARTGDRYDI